MPRFRFDVIDHRRVIDPTGHHEIHRESIDSAEKSG